MDQATHNQGYNSQTPNRRWAEGAIVYQVYPRSFYDSNDDGVGDIAGVTLKLDYLKKLGVNAIWLSPFYPSPMADFGYDVADYCDVDPLFGNLDDMRTLISEAHDRDIKLLVDLVPNHTSDDHQWFQQSRQSKDNQYADWYVWRDAKDSDDVAQPVPPNNWIGVFDGKSAWQWVAARQQFYLHSFDVRQPDLNWDNPAVRGAIKKVMRFWLGMGADGFRVDAVNFMAKDPELRDNPINPDFDSNRDQAYDALIPQNSRNWPGVFEHLSEMAAVLNESAYRDVPRFMVTEAYIPDVDHVEGYMAYYRAMDPGLAAPFNFEGLALTWEAGPWREFLARFHRTLSAYSPLCVPSYAFGNHDRQRLASRLGEPAARSAAVMLLTLPGMAFVYNGEEIGMVDGDIAADQIQDPGAKGRLGRDPERTPMQWSAAKNAGFSHADKTWLPVASGYQTRNVETESSDANSFLSLYQKLGSLRNSTPALKHGDITIVEVGNENVLAYTRTLGNESVLVMINFTDSAASITPSALDGYLVMSSITVTTTKSGVPSKLNPHEAVICVLRHSY